MPPVVMVTGYVPPTRRLEGSTFGIYSHLYDAQVFYFSNQIADARRHLARVLELCSDGASSNVAVYHAQVRLQLCALAEHSEANFAFDPIADARQYREAIMGTPPIIATHTTLIRLLRDIRMGRPERSRETLTALGRTVEDLTDEDSRMAVLNVLLATFSSGRIDDLVAERTAQLRTRSESLHTYAVSMLAHVLEVLILQARGEHSAACDALRAVLVDIERTHHVRYILDFAHLLTPLLREVGGPFVADLLRSAGGPDAENVFGLTEIERRVLRGLARRENTPQIAVSMVLSVHTVRTHVQNIYQKLRVHSREEALSVARAARLL